MVHTNKFLITNTYFDLIKSVFIPQKVIPKGFRNILNWIHNTYDAPDIYITGNGYSDNGELDDQERIDYHLVRRKYKYAIILHEH